MNVNLNPLDHPILTVHSKDVKLILSLLKQLIVHLKASCVKVFFFPLNAPPLLVLNILCFNWCGSCMHMKHTGHQNCFCAAAFFILRVSSTAIPESSKLKKKNDRLFLHFTPIFFSTDSFCWWFSQLLLMRSPRWDLARAFDKKCKTKKIDKKLKVQFHSVWNCRNQQLFPSISANKNY